MKSHHEREPELEMPAAGNTDLTAALLRIGANLDLETVLHEALRSARALTGAHFGVIATLDETGELRDFVSSGMSEETLRSMREWPDGHKAFGFLRDLSGPLRTPDVSAYLKSLGCRVDGFPPCETFQGTPMRHHGTHVGNFYLAGKDGGEVFTDRDEEVLMLFAAQAAASIAHARAYGEERRVRAHLQALIETSPVGVVVFDAVTGKLESMNREATRMMEHLWPPGSPPLELLPTLTFRRADGREFAADQLAPLMQFADTVRAEEILLTTPDGRSMPVLINSTVVHADDGSVGSVVVTMQDLVPLAELERTRTEFLGMVSHELRAPLTSIKGSTATVLGTSRVLNPAETRQFFRIIDEQANRMDGLISDLLDVGRIDAGVLSVSPEPWEVGALIEEARTTFLSGGRRHGILVDLPPDLPRVLVDRPRIVQVLNNLLANSARHAPETSPIRIAAIRDTVHVAISVSDEGRGMAPEQLPSLFRKYYRAGEQGVAGGLGLAICKGLVEAHGGRIRAESDGVGRGMRVTFTIPAVEEADSATPHPSERPRDDGQPARILVVDDDPGALRYIRDTLVEAGYSTLVAGDAADLAHILETQKPQLVLLDLVLPGTDGLKLMERIPALADQPVIFISGYGHDETVAQAFEAGAEDYIVKPFSPTELTARVRAALRRHARPDPFVFGGLSIDYDRRLVYVDSREVELTAIEYELLRVLSLNSGRVLSYDDLLRRVWSGRIHRDPKKLVRVFVRQLRQKLGDDAVNPAYIMTVRGVGYRMAS